jgi:putative ABC transport system substrate-binding protein
MRRRDLAIGLVLTAAVRTARADEPAKQHRIAIVVPAGAAADISDTGNDPIRRREYQAFFEELSRLGDAEGQNLTVERYSGEGRREAFADLAREVVSRNPDLIVAHSNPVAQALRAASGTIPIVWIGVDAIRDGVVTSLARPGGTITGVNLYDYEIWGKRMQILKEAVTSASKIAFLLMRGTWEGDSGQQLRELSQRLAISLIGMPLQQSTPSEYQRVFAEIVQHRLDAIIVHDVGDLVPYRQLIVELIEKSRLPAMYGYREYVEAGGLMAYEADLSEVGRRMADDVLQILNGTKPGDIPIYQSTTGPGSRHADAARADAVLDQLSGPHFRLDGPPWPQRRGEPPLAIAWHRRCAGRADL